MTEFMRAFLRHVTTVLRGEGLQQLTASVAALCWGGAVYGAVMGAFGGLTDERAVQVVYSGVKVPMLLGVTTALALPSFFVLNSLLGLRSDFPVALRAVVGTQGAVAVVLAGLAPYTALWYLSTSAYPEALIFNGLMFAVASFAAQRVLRRRYAPLIARNPRHRVMLWTWLILYCFVAIQMAWVLRPFVGYPLMRPSFFRDEPWGNAYVAVAETLWRVLRR
jgi:hypothetical protein